MRYTVLAAMVAALAVTSVPSPPSVSAQDAGWQGWGAEQRRLWYRATQGSRLVPLRWFWSLERADNSGLFAAKDHLVSFGFVDDGLGDGNPLPAGFAVDRQDDSDLTFSKLRWREGQGSKEYWVGLNCSACHTGEITYRGESYRVDGGQSQLDFQSFVEAFDAALHATRDDAAKFDRFARRVLRGDDTPDNRAMLREALLSLIEWQDRTEALNDTPIRYGKARLDAFGHIFNKIQMFGGAEDAAGNPSDAPVSYPHIWNIHLQRFVQWNGIAENKRISLPGNTVEYGALGRNTGEVLGVFGDLKIEPTGGLLSRLGGYESSANATNLDRLERLLSTLEAPAWPASFPSIDPGRAQRGEGLFRDKCASCHKTPDMIGEGEPTETLLPFTRTSPANLTDIWMACNAFTYDGPAGALEGTPGGYLTGDPIGATAPMAKLLSAAVKGTLVGAKGDIAREAGLAFFGIERPPVVIDAPAVEAGELDPLRAARREICETTEHRLLAYKARPLDGIWATAPYLHNGSVPSLYDLLLPVEDRPVAFWVGSTEFDPVKVGYVYDQPTGENAFRFETLDGDGIVIPGNDNAGHEYGARTFTEDDRLDLVEYMKTL